MDKQRELLATLVADYDKTKVEKGLPLLAFHHASGMEREAFASRYAAGTVSISSATLLAQAYAVAQLGIAARADHLADYLGAAAPKFPLRPLWLGCDIEVAISPLVSLHLPGFMVAEPIECWLPAVARRLIELGYNALLLGSRKGAFISKVASREVDLAAIFQGLEAHGIELIVKANFCLSPEGDHVHKCPFDDPFRLALKTAYASLFAQLPHCKRLFWESMLHFSNYRHHPDAKGATEAEVVLEEVRLLEECSHRHASLIFYIPAVTSLMAKRHAEWMQALLDDMGAKTTLAFSAVAGGVCDDHKGDHPLWHQLRSSPDSSATPLLPIVNVGSVEQGEGLWPTANFDLLERFIPRCRRHNFVGVLGVVNHLPREGSLLDCQLWVAGQSLWRDLPASLLAETWFGAYRRDEDYCFYYAAMKVAKGIVTELGALRTVDCPETRRGMGEVLLAQLKLLIRLFDSEKGSAASARPLLRDYFDLFVADIKRFLEQSLQLSLRLVPGGIGGTELQPSFWTDVQRRGEILKVPQRGAPDTAMEAIYLESRYF